MYTTFRTTENVWCIVHTNSTHLVYVTQAAFFRQVIATRSVKDQQAASSHVGSGAQQEAGATVSKQGQHQDGGTASKRQQPEGRWNQADLDSMLAESLQYAKADVKRFVQETQRAGWNVHPIMLSSYERSTFTPV